MEMDLRNTSLHEAAHFVVARHFRLFGIVEIWRNPDPPTLGINTVLGRLRLYAPPPPFKGSVIAWAGPLVDQLDHHSDPSEMLNPWFMDWLWMEIDGPCEMSKSDHALAFGHKQWRRAARMAGTILNKRWQEVLRFADELTRLYSLDPGVQR